MAITNTKGQTLEIGFVSTGVDSVMRDLKSLEDRLAGFENRLARVYSGKTAKPKGLENVAKALDVVADKQVKAAEKVANAETKAADRAAKAKVDAAEKAQKKINDMVVRNANRAADAEVKAAQKVAREKERAEIASAKKIARETAKATAKATAEGRAFRKDVAGRVSGAVSNVVGTAGKVIGGVAALGGGLSVIDAVRGRMSTETAAVNFSNASVKNGKREVSTEKAQERFNELAKKWGVSGAEVGAAASTLLAKTGSPDQALDEIGYVMKVAKATGSNVGDLAKTWGAIQSQNVSKDVTDLTAQLADAKDPESRAAISAKLKAAKDKSFDERSAILRTMIGQGNEGAVEIKDQGASGVKVMARASMFSGNKIENIGTLGALMQHSEKTSGSAEEAATSTNAFFTDIATKEKMLKGMGVSLYGKDGKMKSAQDTVLDVMKGINGDAKKANAVFGERGIKTWAALNESGDQARQAVLAAGGSKKDGDKAYNDAVKQKIEDMRKQQISEEQLRENAAKVMATQQERISVALEKLRIQVGEKLAPELEKLIPKIAEATPALMKMLDAMIKLANWAGSNPLEAGLAALTLTIGNAVAQAFAANAIQGIVASSFAGVGAPVAIVIAAAVAAALAAKKGIDEGAEHGKNEGEKNRQASYENAALQGKIEKGTASPEEIDRFKQNIKIMKEGTNQSIVGNAVEGAFNGMIGGYKGIANGDYSLGNFVSLLPNFAVARGLYGGISQAAFTHVETGNQKDVQESIKHNEAALDKLTAALNKSADAYLAGAGSLGNTSGNPPVQ